MTTDASNENRLLAEIGVSEQEEQAYRLLLVGGSLTVSDMSAALLLSGADSARLLNSLETKGLAVAVPGAVRCFLPCTPEVAIEALILRKQATLERTRAAIALLKRESEQACVATSTVSDSRGAFSSELEELIPLLAAGLNDKAIAHRLHISVRTLLRRVAKLLTLLNARSRFQAGWAVALRLHGIAAPDLQLQLPQPTSAIQQRRAPPLDWPRCTTAPTMPETDEHAG